MSLDPKLVEAVKSGECLLFIGAGVHYPPSDAQSPYLASYPPEVRPPLGAELAKRLAARGGPPQSYIEQMFPNERDYEWNLQRTAALYEIARGRNELVSEIIKEVDTGKKPSAAVRALAGLPFRLVATSNYDKLFEKALGVLMKSPVREIYSPSHNATCGLKTPKDPDTPAYWKMHGCVDRPDSLVATEEDYITFVTRMRDLGAYNPVPRPFQNALAEMPSLFIGYSLVDFNFRLLLRSLHYGFDSAELARNYAVNPKPDPVVRHALDGRVTFIVEDLWSFIPNLYQAVTGQTMPA